MVFYLSGSDVYHRRQDCGALRPVIDAGERWIRKVDESVVLDMGKIPCSRCRWPKVEIRPSARPQERSRG